jgi:3-mercaptopyruvate sulfurtransferase SseA
MTGIRIAWWLPGLALAVGACADKPQGPPDPGPAEVIKKPASKKKPVRMTNRGKITSISLTDFFALQQSDKVLLFDARPAFFYGLGHIPGAINLPKTGCDPQIEKREAEIKAALAENKTIVVYCTNLLCPDARAVAIHLAGYGYPSSILTGGWESYKESGLPTE